MSTPRTKLRLALLQVRSEKVPLLQEQSCFIERCRVARGQMTFINLVEEPELRWRHVENAHAVIIGGAGDYSVTHEHPFTNPLRDVVLRLIEANRPVFGSCWGHQFLAETLGGVVIGDRERAEIGSLPIDLSPAGMADPLFAGFPERFYVQLGHNDRVSAIGPDCIELASTDLCPYQAIRLRDKPVYGTQFHSEMNEDRLRERLEIYLDDYVPDEARYRQILRMMRPSLEADGLMARFLELYA